jgi:hypothetical protein
VINVAPGQWLARYGDGSIGPESLARNKAAAMAMVLREISGQPATDGLHRYAYDLRPSAILSTNDDDGTFRLDLKWGVDWSATFPRSEYPGDDAAYTFCAWGYRETFSLSWSNGKIATFITPVVIAADVHGDVRISDSFVGARHYVSTPPASLIVDNTNPYLAQIENASDIPAFLDRGKKTSTLAA